MMGEKRLVNIAAPTMLNTAGISYVPGKQSTGALVHIDTVISNAESTPPQA